MTALSAVWHRGTAMIEGVKAGYVVDDRMVWIQSTASKDADEVLGDFMDKVEENDPLFNWTRRNDKGVIAATNKK
eukprot:4219781-Karenia_brevis.AAC.1